jgi:two-component system chemotaxis response regulator CheB
MSETAIQAIAIGTSAGGLEALSVILPALPQSFKLPIFVVVHVPPDRRSLLPELFRAKCRIPVREPEDKEPIADGTVYFAPPDYHLLVEKDNYLSLSSDEPVFYSRPSIDVLFESAADVYGPALMAIILTGANQDGAAGIKGIARSGGTVIVQDPAEAFAAAMPEAALAACPSARILSLDAIAAQLQEM